MYIGKLATIIIIVVCLVFVGFVGLQMIPRTQYDYYPGLSSDVYDYGAATRSALLYFTGWAQMFNERYYNNTQQIYDLYLVGMTRTTITQNNTETADVVYVILYLPKDSTIETLKNDDYRYMIYGYKAPSGSRIDYYIREQKYYWAWIRSWINGDVGVGNANKIEQNKNVLYKYRYNSVQGIDIELLNTSREYYEIGSITKYESQINMEGFYIIQDYEK